MATTFLEPGGDADFQAASGAVSFWSGRNGTPIVATDFVHGGHVKSLKYGTNGFFAVQRSGVVSDAGTRISIYFFIHTLPTATAALFTVGSGATQEVAVKITSGGVLQLFEKTVQIGTNGSTLSTGIWYRISLAYTVSSTTVNNFRLFKNGTLDISVTNATITNTGITLFVVGFGTSDATFDLRSSDHYVDNSSSLTDTGNIWVTAKRPFSNGTTNGFTTQIGSGGSGYGTGHAPQVNERPLSTTNGWSIINAGSVTTEEYTIEDVASGDIDIMSATIVDYTGWVCASSVTSETASIIVAGSTSNISLTSTATIFTKIAGSSTYPAGGTDIGVVTSATITTVGLYECGILVAFIPSSTNNSSFLAFI